MKIVAVIPARFDSVRFRGKPLVKILGIPMIERVYRQVEKAGKFMDIIVATDDFRIAETVEKFGGHYSMTSKDHKSGTERVWEVVAKSEYEAVVNIQGDEPLVDESLISEVYTNLESGAYDVVSAAFFNSSFTEYKSENVVKIALNRDGYALYFSRSPIPFVRYKLFKGFFHHIGIYGYKRKAIESFIKLPPSDLELSEKLEQLRFIDNHFSIKIFQSDYKSIAVDVPQDIEKIENLIRSENG